MAPLKLSIPAAHDQIPADGKPYTEYTVRIEHAFPRPATSIAKRYSEFAALDAALCAATGSAPPVPLPPKSWFGGLLGARTAASAPHAIEKRRVGLEAYLRAIEGADDARWRVCRAYRDFLALDDPASSSNRVAGDLSSLFNRNQVRDSSEWLDKYAALKASLHDARRWLTVREQATAAQAQHEAAAHAKKSLVRAGALLAALDEALGRLSRSSSSNKNNSNSTTTNHDTGGDTLGDGEVRRRRDMLGSLRKERDGLDALLTTMAVQAARIGSSTNAPTTSPAAVSAQQHASLFAHRGSTSSTASAHGSSRRILGAPIPAPETETTRQLDNSGVLQLQRQIIAAQDDDLVDLATVVRRMREMGVHINAEIVEQNALLGLLGEDVERVDGKVRIASKRADKIR